jgi:hypothetical protein
MKKVRKYPKPILLLRLEYQKKKSRLTFAKYRNRMRSGFAKKPSPSALQE